MKRITTLALVSVIAGLMAHFGIFYFLEFETPRQRPRPAPAASVEYVGNLGLDSDPVIQEQGLLFDSAPLFMPTSWNLASEMGSVASLREATEVFALFPPELSLPDDPPDIRESVAGDQDLGARELPRGSSFVMAPFGRAGEAPPAAVPAPTALEVRRFHTGVDAETIHLVVPTDIRAQMPQSLSVPVKLHLQLSRGRPVGWPVIARSSGFTEWDEVLQQFIGSLEFTRSLRDGYYLITAYP
jgi:hypothetical protein